VSFCVATVYGYLGEENRVLGEEIRSSLEPLESLGCRIRQWGSSVRLRRRLLWDGLLAISAPCGADGLAELSE
jgi:hypothetical protein